MKPPYLKGITHPIYIFKNMPKRIIRLGLHLMPFIKNDSKLDANSLSDWLFDLPFYISDLIGLPEIFETIILFTNPSIHSISFEHNKSTTIYFENCCDLSKVMLRSNAKLFTKNFALAYVTFNVVNYLDKIEDHILNHELVHICQYQKFGSVYIFRSLKAQRSKEGYDYGGYFGLSQKIASGKCYEDLNFEQQAQFIEDYSELKTQNIVENIAPYNYYYKQFKNWFSNKTLSNY